MPLWIPLSKRFGKIRLWVFSLALTGISFGGIFIIPFLFFKKKEKLFNILVPIFIIFFIGIFLSGNRMPVVLFIIYSLLILIFIKEIRIPIMIASILSLIISIAILNTDEEKKRMYSSFYYNAVSIFPMIFNTFP